METSDKSHVLKDSFRCFVSKREEGMGDIKLEKGLKDFYIPDYIIGTGLKMDDTVHSPSCPVIVFINSKSGGQLGGELLVTYRNLLNKNQVIDLGECAPDKVLHQFYANLHSLKVDGDQIAAEIEKHLRVIVAGGDGTAGWILGVISDLKLPKPPPVATVPLGTGNNLPYSFGWGKKNPGTDEVSVKVFLAKVLVAKEMKVDSWHIIMRMRNRDEVSCDPIAPLELPHSLHAFRRVSHSDSANMEGYLTFRGGFWNYFSIGMDAQVSYAFHSARKLHPEKFNNQLANQKAYLKLGFTQGWFCASLCHPSSRNMAKLAKVKIVTRQGEWKDLSIPQSIRSIVCLNLPSFSGGLNPWGKPDQKKAINRDLTPPFVDDGLLEVVGFRDALHGLVLLSPGGHGTRLAQASRIRFEFHKGAASHTYMRMDGEPWKQPLPVDDDTVVVEIANHGQVTMLATPLCQSKSINDPAAPESNGDPRTGTNEDDDSSEDWEERRKFGASDTFRLPDSFDVSKLG